MIAKRTAIGISIGCIIIGLGAASLIVSLGIQLYEQQETLSSGSLTSFSLNAPASTQQRIVIDGDLFEVELNYPGNLEESNVQTYKEYLDLKWVQTKDGTSRLAIRNTGESDLTIQPTFVFINDPILLTYHVIVVIGGIIIIGFSLGFTLRKPRGF